MKKLAVLLAALLGVLSQDGLAQDTNTLKTQIGVFESRTGSVIIKAVGMVGTVAAGAQEIGVRVKETSDISIGQKIYGVAISIEGGPFPRDLVYVDDNEVDGLLNAINYLLKVKYDVTTLPSFDASFTTKAGLRISAHSIRREGTIQHALQYADGPRIFLDSMQMSQLYNLIAQARKNLDALKADR